MLPPEHPYAPPEPNLAEFYSRVKLDTSVTAARFLETTASTENIKTGFKISTHLPTLKPVY